MKTIPVDERAVTDREVFAAFNLSFPGLERVRNALDAEDIPKAKQELVRYFETRSNVSYCFDYRQMPLQPVDTDSNPYIFQSAMGLLGSLKDFCLFAGRKLLQHIYVRPGRERRELDLGAGYENLPHFNYFEDQGKKHRTTLDIFVRGTFMEYLSILYHENGDHKVVDFAEEFLQVFWKNYPLLVEYTDPGTSHFSKLEERDVMSVGWLALNHISLLYTRLPYEMSPETAFEIIKHIWFLGIQFRRFDTDGYRKYNHHLWERGIVPFILGTLFPEIPDFAGMKERGADTVRRHVRDDFSKDGGYGEHSIPYWCGATLSEMLCRGIYLARLNGETLLDKDTWQRVYNSFDILAMISAPGDCYPSLGDHGGAAVEPVLQAGSAALNNKYCGELLEFRRGTGKQEHEIPLDYCNDNAGYFCTKSSLMPDADYALMSVKVNGGDTGHNHMDLLSLFITIHGQEFIGEPYARALYHTVPPGNPLRGYMYNMGSHNTVLAYGEPVQPDCFYSSKWGIYCPDTPVEAFSSEENGCYVRAYHDAYTHCRHVRELLFCRSRGFLIRDVLVRGNRAEKANIQRWHLFPDVKYVQTGKNSVLLEKRGAKALLLWTGTPVLRIWTKRELCPLIVKEESDIAATIDVEFKEESPDSGVAAQSLLVLDVTGKIPGLEAVDEICSLMIKDAKEGRLSEALSRFEDI